MDDTTEFQASLLGVVLCGGRSQRMGRDKASLLHPSGVSFLQHAVIRLKRVCDRVCISTSPDRSLEDIEGVDLLHDPVAFQGPVVGVAQALQHAGSHGFSACLVTPVDMPDLTAEDLTRLRDQWHRDPNRVICAVDARTGQLQPLVTIYPIGLADELRSLAASKDRRLYRWIEKQSPVLIPLSAPAVRNVNSPEDLSKVEDA